MSHIQNLDKLVAKLNNVSETAVKDALTQACLEVEREAKIQCPVDDGQLRQSITFEVTENQGVVGTNVEYAPYVHQGTGIYAADGDGRKERWKYQDAEGNWHSTIGQGPQPFLESALNSKRKEIMKIFQKQIKEGLQGG